MSERRGEVASSRDRLTFPVQGFEVTKMDCGPFSGLAGTARGARDRVIGRVEAIGLVAKEVENERT